MNVPHAVECPHCAGPAPFEFSASDRNLRVSQRLFDYFRCGNCGLLFQAGPPDDLDRYYPHGYYDIPRSLSRLEVLAGREQFKVDLILPYCAGGDLLEIGPAWGSFAYAAKTAGFSVSVVETDERCRRFLAEVVGIKVHVPTSTNALPADLGAYDVVALWQVIEHLPEFERLLLELAGRVRPGGILAIATPNPDAWQFQVMGRSWPHVDAPRHLQLIPAKLLTEVLGGLGFSVVDQTTTDEGGLSWNRFGWQRLLGNAVPPWRPFRAAALVVGFVISKLMAPLDNRPNRGATNTLLLRRAPR